MFRKHSGTKDWSPAVPKLVSTCIPGLIVQCGDRIHENDNLEWARLGWGNPERAADPAWASGKASWRRSYRREQNSPVLAGVQLTVSSRTGCSYHIDQMSRMSPADKVRLRPALRM